MSVKLATGAAQRILAASPAVFHRALDQAVLAEAQLYKREIVVGLTSGRPAGGAPLKPLALSTLKTRRARGIGGSKPLIERGDLRRSIRVVRSEAGVFVGVHRTARGRDGQSLANIAEVNEFGKIIVRRSGDGVTVVEIPKRPFIRPVFKKLKSGSARRVVRRVSRTLAGTLGIV